MNPRPQKNMRPLRLQVPDKQVTPAEAAPKKAHKVDARTTVWLPESWSARKVNLYLKKIRNHGKRA